MQPSVNFILAKTLSRNLLILTTWACPSMLLAQAARRCQLVVLTHANPASAKGLPSYVNTKGQRNQRPFSNLEVEVNNRWKHRCKAASSQHLVGFTLPLFVTPVCQCVACVALIFDLPVFCFNWNDLLFDYVLKSKIHISALFAKPTL